MRYIFALLLALFLAACQDDPLERGVAAKVNGRPIELKILEYAQGLKISTSSAVPGEAMARLREEYGETLAGLIVEELVFQELAKRGIEVGEADLKKAETAVRSGYPGRTFEDTLQEEGLDLDVWRERLRARVALDMFMARVLRPRVPIASWEVQQYYKEHSQEFVQPARVRFVKVESKTAESLRKALDAAKAAPDPAGMLTVFEDVVMGIQALSGDAITPKVRDALKGLQPGQVSPVAQGGMGFQAYMLLERTESRVDGLVQVYPLVEKRLLEVTLAREFSLWLTSSLDSSVIEINPGLIPEKAKQ